MQAAPTITTEAIFAALDHAFVMFAGAANSTEQVDRAIYGSGTSRVSRVTLQRCATNPDATIALFVGSDGEDEYLCPVLSFLDYDLFCGAAAAKGA